MTVPKYPAQPALAASPQHPIWDNFSRRRSREGPLETMCPHLAGWPSQQLIYIGLRQVPRHGLAHLLPLVGNEDCTALPHKISARNCWHHPRLPSSTCWLRHVSLKASPSLLPAVLGTMRPVLSCQLCPGSSRTSIGQMPPRTSMAMLSTARSPVKIQLCVASSRDTRDGTERKVPSQTFPPCLALSHTNSADTSSRVSACVCNPLV